MKVVCIDDDFSQEPETSDFPTIKKGKIYHAIDEVVGDKTGAIYYILLECGNENAYLTSLFVPVIEDEKDEEEIQKERNQNLVNAN